MSNLNNIDSVIESLQGLISNIEIDMQPPQELLTVKGFETIYKSLLELRKAFMNIAAGELTYPIKGKGYLPGALKSLQASLQHMTWQAKSVAAGDFDQSVDFMGEFSEAFNNMTMQLKSTLKESARAENEAKEAREHFEIIFNTSPNSTLITRVDDGSIVDINQAFLALFGYTREEVIGKTTLELNFNNLANRKKMVHELSLNGFYENIEMIFHKKNGDEIICLISAKIITLKGVLNVVNVVTDITERKRSEQLIKKSEGKLIQSEKKYRLLIENALESIIVVQDGNLKFCNPISSVLTGYSYEELTSIPFVEFIHPDDRNLIVSNYLRTLSGEQIESRYQYRVVRKDKEIRWVEMNSILIEWEGRAATLNFQSDVTQRKQSEAEIIYLNYHDLLTGLYNRRFYEEELKRIDTENNLPITLIMADVNGLKLTNDAFGHLAGDKLIKEIAQIFKKECGPDNIVARIGGDEFIILLPKTDSIKAEKLVKNINKAAASKKIDNTILSVAFGWGTKNQVNEEISKIYMEAEDQMYSFKLSESTNMKRETIKIIIKTLYEKNEVEQHHAEKVSELCMSIGTVLNLSSEEVKDLGIAGLMHDIGKIGINDKILNKPGKLNYQEWLQIKRHPEIGYHILKSSNEFSNIAEYVLAHHERIDGMGYPRGLKGDEIPLQSKILCIAEAYATMSTARIYKDALDEESSIKELKANAATQFDEGIAEIFVEMVLGKQWKTK